MALLEKIIFVTVGTTLFDHLINIVSKQIFLSQIASLGYTTMIIQYGKGKPPLFSGANVQVVEGSICDSGNGYLQYKLKILNEFETAHDGHRELNVSCYRFKSTIKEDMQRSSLIISHAGAGSIMESLSLKKKTCVIINDALMDNHQIELAQALCDRGYLFMLPSPDNLILSTTIKSVESFKAKEWKGGRPSSFGKLIADFMGFNPNTTINTKIN